MVSTVAFCLPGEALPQQSWFDVVQLDKWIHIGIFSGMISLWSLPFFHRTPHQPLSKILVYVVIVSLSYGVAIEFVQHFFIAHRSFDLGDIAADAVGCTVGFLFVKRIHRSRTGTKAIKMVCFYGPESTGKSVMAERMAARYHTEFVPEVAREMITSNDFTAEDIIKIGQAHYERIQQKLKTANRILFCDTDAITTQIYSKKYLGTIPPVLFKLEKKVTYDYYFLFDIDVPWVADGLRDLGDERQEMLTIFSDELKKRNIPFFLVRGNFSERERFISERVEQLLKN
jgi:nicotinamide riboside kinase